MNDAATTIRAAQALLESAIDLLKDARDVLEQGTPSHAALSSLATHGDACMWHLKQAMKREEG